MLTRRRKRKSVASFQPILGLFDDQLGDLHLRAMDEAGGVKPAFGFEQGSWTAVCE